MLVALECGDSPESWAALGFQVTDGVARVGTVDVLLDGRGGGIRGWHLAPLPDLTPPEGEIPHAPPTTWIGPREAPPGARGLDHVVLLTGFLDDTVEALQACGGDLRRRADIGRGRMAWVRMGPSIVEVVEREGSTRIWGLVAIVEDLTELPTDLIGAPKDAVQAGRRIVTVRPEAGLGAALAFMTPRTGSNPVAPGSTNA